MDIVGYMITQTPIVNWTNEKKQEMLDMFCSARGYKATVGGEPNPMTKKEFANIDMLNYLINICNNEKRRQALAAVVVNEFEVE